MKALLAALSLIVALSGCGQDEESRTGDDLILPALY